MAEFEEKLNSLLGDPEAMGQIVSIARALTGGDGPAPEDGPPPDPEHVGAEAASEADGEGPDLSSIMGLLGGLMGNGAPSANPLSALGDLDPRLISTALRLFSEYSATDNRKVALLSALKPFLKEERYAKVDKAVQIAKLSRVVRVAFQIFKESGDGGDTGV